MRAWELRDFGWENLVLAERPVPEPGPGQVLVRVGGAALNSRDLQILHDQYYPDQRFPIVLGSDGAGEVVAVGEGVERPAVGDRVAGAFAQGWISGERTWERWLTHLGGQLDGVFADYVVFEADAAIPVPSYLSDVEAAAATSAAATAWRALVEVGHVRPGDTVLVQGTGGVALFALQFAQLAGARVIVTSSSDEKLARCPRARRVGRRELPDAPRVARGGAAADGRRRRRPRRGDGRGPRARGRLPAHGRADQHARLRGAAPGSPRARPPTGR